jgi:CHAD domain-containing protein
VLAKYAEAIDRNWDGAIANEDPEFLHRLRVAIRRTRATLASAKGVIGKRDRRWFQRRFARLATATSAARDLDVAVVDWPGRIELLDPATRDALSPVHDVLLTRQRLAHDALNHELSRPRTRRLIRRWRSWLTQKPRHGRRADAAIGEVVARQRKKLTARLTSLERVDSVEARHALRKNAKRLRYIVDGFASLFEDDERDALIDRLVRMQDELGRGRDAVVQADIVRSILAELPANDETAGAGDALIRSLVSSEAANTPPRPPGQDAPPTLTPWNT